MPFRVQIIRDEILAFNMGCSRRARYGRPWRRRLCRRRRRHFRSRSAGPARSAWDASAQTYPDRPVTMLVAFPPGGADDAIARIIQDPPLAKIHAEKIDTAARMTFMTLSPG